MASAAARSSTTRPPEIFLASAASVRSCSAFPTLAEFAAVVTRGGTVEPERGFNAPAAPECELGLDSVIFGRAGSVRSGPGGW